VDQQQTQNINQAMEQLADSAQHSFQMLAARTVRVQERNLMLTQTFFQNWIEQVHNQAQATRGATQDLQEQGQRQREAFETLSEEASNVYSEYLDSALSFYQEGMSTASQVAQGNLQNAARATQQGMQAASQASQQTVEAASQAVQQGMQGLPTRLASRLRRPVPSPLSSRVRRLPTSPLSRAHGAESRRLPDQVPERLRG
jgi:hypothetical protein